jgi:hypothetical protein
MQVSSDEKRNPNDEIELAERNNRIELTKMAYLNERSNYLKIRDD